MIVDYAATLASRSAGAEPQLEKRNADRARALREEIMEESVPVAEAARLIGRTEQTAINRAKAGEMLAFRDGAKWMFPGWQFDASHDGGVVPGLRETCAALGVPPFTAVTWFRKPSRALGNRRPIDVLRAGELETVLTAAKSTGSQ
ncbi:MAG TPA: antitoxin Xre/MbcA/ParS toxin-binding domain-containing protein [Candidatus Elarobacter sp.]|nr:antitoxin Xre/MbcA/ParS toxin-binding domain-containing protein [Candidatus Elarobacter sp.]